jgi:uncharacterized protein (TIGR03085 family)
MTTDAGTVRPMSTPARAERERFSELLAQVGPDAPTLCGGWTTRDLAAHLVVRERRPDGAAGLVIRPLASYTDKVQAKVAATEWEELIDTVRGGPPVWSPTRLDAVDRVTNTIEFFVHHEDVRRATDPWEPRELPDDLTDDLHAGLKRAARLLARKAPSGLVLEPTDGRNAIVAKKDEPTVTVRGPVGELVLFVYGRQDHARVDFDGDAALVEALRTAEFGF